MGEVLSEKTLIPISLVIVLVGGVFWLTTIYWRGISTAEAVLRVESKQDLYLKEVQEINARLTTIEATLGVKRDQ